MMAKMRRKRDHSQRGSDFSEITQSLAPCSKEVVGVVPSFCLLAFQYANPVCLTKVDHYWGGMQAFLVTSMYVPPQTASIRAMLAYMPSTLLVVLSLLPE